jgi:hypothetical protein
MHSCELRGHAIRPWKVLFVAVNAGYVNRFQAYQLYLQARSSQPSGEVRCDWMWLFRKRALSTFQFKLNTGFIHEIEFRLSIHQVCLFFYSIYFRDPYFLVWFSRDHKSMTLQNRTCVIWAFWVTKARILSPTFMSKARESPYISAYV